MIKAVCHTNWDDFSFEKWPKFFVAVPQKGDYVQSCNRVVAKVAYVTHCVIEEGYGDNYKQTPYIEVELVKP